MRNFLFEECTQEERIEKLNSIAACKEQEKSEQCTYEDENEPDSEENAPETEETRLRTKILHND